MVGRHGKLTAQAGKRSELTAILLEAAEWLSQLPGCQLYLVAEDESDEVTLHVFELWTDQAAHAASLEDERVQALIAQARPILGGPPSGTSLTIAGGHGLPR